MGYGLILAPVMEQPGMERTNMFCRIVQGYRVMFCLSASFLLQHRKTSTRCTLFYPVIARSSMLLLMYLLNKRVFVKRFIFKPHTTTLWSLQAKIYSLATWSSIVVNKDLLVYILLKAKILTVLIFGLG